MLNYFISSILKGSVKDIYLAALLSFVFLFSISLKCNFFVFVDVLLCFSYVFHSYSGMLMRIYSLEYESADVTINFSHLIKFYCSFWQSGVG